MTCSVGNEKSEYPYLSA